MRGFNIFIVILSVAFSCAAQNEQTETRIEKANEEFMSYGDKINLDNTNTATEMLEGYQNLGTADTLRTKFTAKVKEVCKAKGCWMKLVLTNEEEVMVRFEDYGFFVPTDIDGREVVVNGAAYVEQMSVADQKHFAKDGGMQKDQIDAISKPKMIYGFEANGVLVKQ